MGIPDVVGYTLGEAKSLLGKALLGIDTLVVTSPPKYKTTEYDDSFRVINVKVIDNKIQMLICKPL